LGAAPAHDILPAIGGGTATAPRRGKGKGKARERARKPAGAKPAKARPGPVKAPEPDRLKAAPPGFSDAAPAGWDAPATGPRKAPAQPADAAKQAEALQWNAKGGEARAKGENALAIQCFQRALALDPDNPVFHNDVGNVFLDGGMSEKAEHHYRMAVRLKPDFAIAWTNLGLTFIQQDADLQGGIECLRRSTSLNPRNGEAWLLMGTALRRLGRPADALPALEQALARRAGLGRVQYQMGLAELALGRQDRALASFRRALAARPGDVFVAAEIANLEAVLRHPDLPPGAKRVALHINQRFHDAILRPLFEELAKRHRAIVTADARRLVEFDPDIVIVADAQSEPLRRLVPRAQFVFTRHGLISKNSPGRAVPMSDYACITSEASKQWYIENGIVPRKGFWITGYAQADPLFRDEPLPLPFALPRGMKTVLYAPTFNDFLSSAPMLGPRTVELIRGTRRDISIIIKPHPHICAHRAAWMDWWRAAAARAPGVFLVEDPAADLVPYLKAADLLVSDASSATMMYLALDRPIVLITNPDAGKDKERFDPNGPEWTWRDMGEEVFDVSDLAAAVARGLDDPDSRRDRRAHYRRLLFGDLTDGRAVERIAADVTALKIERAP